MLDKTHRLRDTALINQIKESGRSWHNHRLVLVKQANSQPNSRFAISASRRIGNAVVRNRTKRRIRESIRRHLPELAGGWDVVVIARHSASQASFDQIDSAVSDLLRQARLLCVPLIKQGSLAEL
jgi:ribonuclease P protein component